MQDEKIIDLFFQRSEQAINELDQKYGKIFRNLSFNILNNYLDLAFVVELYSRFPNKNRLSTPPHPNNYSIY